MLRVENLDDIAARGSDHAAVADLAAGFAIKRRLGGEQVDFFAFDRFGFAAAAAENSNHRRFVVEPVVADKADSTIELDLGFHADGLARFAAARALLFHEFFKAGLVDVDIFTAQNVFGQIERKAVGVVKAKGDIAGEGALILAT